MIEELLKYRDELKASGEELEKAGYTLNIKKAGRTILRMGKVKNRSYFGMLGPVEVKDTARMLELAKELRG